MKNHGTSLYMVINNTILIGNLKGGYARIQTLAHECAHSIQNKKMLIFNYIYSNLYILYFIILIGLTIFKVIPPHNVQIFILTFLGLVFFAIRSYLETDAMIKAKYLAKQYLEQTNKCSTEEIAELINSYNEINKQTIPFTNYMLLTKVCTKVLIYCIISGIVVYF